jgi:hypothetical protein
MSQRFAEADDGMQAAFRAAAKRGAFDAAALGQLDLA